MRQKLKVPTINEAWSKIRRQYDPSDQTEFQHRAGARRIAVDLGYATDDANVVTTNTELNNAQIHSNEGDVPGWHCYACSASALVQPRTRTTCESCGAPRDDVS